MNKKQVYVVTRNSRRIEERNYSIKEDAEERAELLAERRHAGPSTGTSA